MRMHTWPSLSAARTFAASSCMADTALAASFTSAASIARHSPAPLPLANAAGGGLIRRGASEVPKRKRRRTRRMMAGGRVKRGDKGRSNSLGREQDPDGGSYETGGQVVTRPRPWRYSAFSPASIGMRARTWDSDFSNDGIRGPNSHPRRAA